MIGGGYEITITRHGRPVAVIVRPDALRTRRVGRDRVARYLTFSGYVRPDDMTMTPMPPREGWLEHLVPVGARVITWATTWPGACAGVSVVLVVLIYRLLAERQRRKTLLTTYLHAPGGTIVVQGEGPAGPPMWVWVGDGSRSVTPTVVVWVTPLSASRWWVLLSRRRS